MFPGMAVLAKLVFPRVKAGEKVDDTGDRKSERQGQRKKKF